MPVLNRQRWEVFCQGLATGIAVEQAYVNAGFSENGAEKSSRRLRAHPKIASRVAELRTSIASGLAEITEVAPIQELIAPEIASPVVATKRVFVLGNIADRVYRVSVLEDLLNRHLRLVQARAIDMKDVPGGETGLLVRRLKVIGSSTNRRRGGDGESVVERTEPDVREEYAYDGALAKEIRELTKEAGIEMGQRTEKQDVTVHAPAAEQKFDDIPLEQLIEARDLMERARAMLTIEAAPGSVEEVKEVHSQEPGGDDAVIAQG